MFSKKTKTFDQKSLAQITFKTAQEIEFLLDKYIEEYNHRQRSNINSLNPGTAYLGNHLSLNASLANYSKEDLKVNIMFLLKYFDRIKKQSTDTCALDTAMNQYNKIMGYAGYKEIKIKHKKVEISLSKILTLEVRDLVEKTQKQIRMLEQETIPAWRMHNTL